MKTLILSFLHNGYRLEETHPDFRKTYLLNISFLLITATCLSFAVLNLFLDEYLESPWHLLSAAIFCICALIYFHRTDNAQRSAEFLIGILILTLLAYFYAVQNKNYGLYWMAGLPPITYFLLGSKKARKICILFFFCILLFIWIGHEQWGLAEFNSQSLLNISGATLGLTLLVAFYERSRKEAADALTRANETLKENKEDLQLILDTAGEGIFGIDMQGVCTFCNTRGLELLGYADESDLIGRKLYPLVYMISTEGTPIPPAECRILRAITTRKNTYSDQEVFQRSDGNYLEVESLSGVHYDPDLVPIFAEVARAFEREQADRHIEPSGR
jgi:PAS domain S-box-containing protein